MHWIWSLQVQSPLCWVFQLMSSHLGPGELLLSWHLGLSSGYSQFHTLQCYTPPFNFLTLCTSRLSPPTPDTPPTPFFSPPRPRPHPSLPSLPFIIFLLSKTEASIVLLVKFHMVSYGLWVVSWVFQALGLISTYQWLHTMCILLRMISSSSVQLPTNLMKSFFLNSWVVPLSVNVPHYLYQFPC